jgi:hypothetical protein
MNNAAKYEAYLVTLITLFTAIEVTQTKLHHVCCTWLSFSIVTLCTICNTDRYHGNGEHMTKTGIYLEDMRKTNYALHQSQASRSAIRTYTSATVNNLLWLLNSAKIPFWRWITVPSLHAVFSIYTFKCWLRWGTQF